MAKVLNEVIPNIYYGLCTSHIMQNGIKTFREFDER